MGRFQKSAINMTAVASFALFLSLLPRRVTALQIMSASTSRRQPNKPKPHLPLKPISSVRNIKPRVLFLTESYYPDGESCTRRNFLSAAAGAAAAASVAAPAPADASVKGAKGAAEYDLEFYLRDILKGNTREGNLPASAAPAALPPRRLSGALLPLLLDGACTTECVPARELARISGKPPGIVSDAVADYRAKASKAFASKAQWTNDDVSDQYYFDLTAYALWRTAADLIPDLRRRDDFARNVGRGVYNEARKMGLLRRSPLTKATDEASSDDSEDTSKESSDDGSASSDSSDSSDDMLFGPLTGTIPAVLEVLDLFNSTQFCSSYRLGGDDATRSGQLVFDELDDDDIVGGASVNCLVSIYQPATLGAALQITGEGSRFSPDFVGNTLLAIWEEAGISASFESYFVDQEYRPNPKDFFPNEQLLQFSLTKKK